MPCRIVFCDVDGTLLSSRHEVLPGTVLAAGALKARGIPLVIVSARSPRGIRPIQREYGLEGPVAAYSGALVFDTDGSVISSVTFPLREALAVVRFLEAHPLKSVWNLFSGESWYVSAPSDPHVRAEEDIVKTFAERYAPGVLPEGAGVHKILVMCGKQDTAVIERDIRSAFPLLNVCRSSDVLIEIMAGGAGKDTAVRALCGRYGIPPDEAAAFGDQFNDADMLRAVGMPVVMGNAPEAMKAEFPFVTEDNDSEGIYSALKKLGVI